MNYVVSSNEDIFEYIKRDILSFLVKEPEYKEIDWQEALKGVIDFESVLNGVEGLMDLLDPKAKLLLAPFKLFQKIDDRYAIDKYFDAFKNTQGGLFEFDDFSIAIKTTLSKIQEKGRKTVLIIEDLDRIDPEHLFRILNVLGAHVDDDKNTNKFGFDNIVAVLDYDTTEHIFHHFYGAQANYKGYMSKFMSSYPFRYSITEVAHEQLREYLKNECHVELLDEFPKDINGRSLLETVNSLSVREIVQILDDINNQIDPTDVELLNGYKTHSNDYITRFLAVLVRMGYKVSKIAIINYYTDEFAHFVGLNNYLLTTGSYSSISFDFNGHWCGYSVRYDGDYKFINRTGGVGGDIVNISSTDIVLKALDTAIDKVKDGKQILVYK